MDISVVIPSRDDPAGLYFTFAAASAELEYSGLYSEIIAVVDGEWHETARAMRQHQACRVVNGVFGSPQHARHFGAEQASGKYVFFLDSHVVPCRDFFRCMVNTAEETGAAIVYSPHATWARGVMGYGYGVDWCGNLWSKDHQTEPLVMLNGVTQKSVTPYRVAMMGHGGICVNREKYFAAGGYWLAQTGWGGEESHLSLKLWMLGHETWVDPRIYHWHYMAHRRGEEIFVDREHVRNFLISAYALGGEKYLNRCFFKYTMARNVHATPEAARNVPAIDPYRDLYEAAPMEAAEERARICAGPFGGDLDKLRAFFRQNEIHN